MTEAAAIARSSFPVTREALAADLARLGVRPGMTLLVHCAMSRMGWVCGGARTVIEALLTATGPDGTIVMPAQTPHLSEPSLWVDPPIPESWWETIRATMPPYDPRLTETHGMGRAAAMFRHWPGAERSAHPQVSFCALGPKAAEILREQPLEDPFGPASPLGAIARLNGRVLMIGTGWETCTMLHLAERLADPGAPREEEGAPMMVNGARKWVRFLMPVTDPDRFAELGAGLDAAPFLRRGPLGVAPSRLFEAAPAVDQATATLRAAARPARAVRSAAITSAAP